MTAQALTDLERLSAALAAECAHVEQIEVAYVAPDASAFAIQTVVGRHRRTEGHWLHITPVYSTGSDTSRTVREIVAKLQGRFLGVTGNAVSYVFRSGGGWVEAYRRKV